VAVGAAAFTFMPGLSWVLGGRLITFAQPARLVTRLARFYIPGSAATKPIIRI
jgi:hypothetical protein